MRKTWLQRFALGHLYREVFIIDAGGLLHRNDFICEAKHSQNSSYLYYAMIDITDMEGGGGRSWIPLPEEFLM